MNINSTTASLRKLFVDNNTTTNGGLSESLEKKVQLILSGIQGSHSNLPGRIDLYPYLHVEAASNVRDFESLGNNSRRENTATWDIIAATYYGQGSGDQHQAKQFADMELLQLCANIEGIIDNNVNAIVDWMNVSSVNYSSQIGDKTYQAIATIQVTGRSIS